MKYRVGWKQTAEDELTLIWINAPDRAKVTAAANAIERLLGTAPSTAGVPFQGSQRAIYNPPLTVLFEIDEDDLFVHVLAVWRL